MHFHESHMSAQANLPSDIITNRISTIHAISRNNNWFGPNFANNWRVFCSGRQKAALSPVAECFCWAATYRFCEPAHRMETRDKCHLRKITASFCGTTNGSGKWRRRISDRIFFVETHLGYLGFSSKQGWHVALIDGVNIVVKYYASLFTCLEREMNCLTLSDWLSSKCSE